jgi:catechol 2,3-dioxygenase-like lactoylglutathione lyase family enzyme
MTTPAFKELNHVALHVADVARSCAFYEQMLGLERIPRPAFRFPGAWYRLGRAQELHLIGERGEAVHSHHRGNHFALLTDDMDAWERRLQSQGCPYLPRRTRPDGAFQIYVTDPDGHVIEICTRPPGGV